MKEKIEHTGIITQIENKNIKVQIVQMSACSSCHAKSACSASDSDEKMIDVESENQNFKVGDTVLLTGVSSFGLFAVLLAFVVPFLLILLSLSISRLYIENEALSGTLSLAILLPYYFILSLFNEKLKNKFRFTIEKT